MIVAMCNDKYIGSLMRVIGDTFPQLLVVEDKVTWGARLGRKTIR
jgi:hypothetical protein